MLALVFGIMFLKLGPWILHLFLDSAKFSWGFRFGSFHVICKALLLAFRTSHIISIVGSNHELFCMVSTHESQGLSHYVVEFEMQKFEEVKVRILSIQSH